MVVSSGTNHNLFLDDKDNVWALGSSKYCGIDSKESTYSPLIQIESLINIQSIYCGSFFSLCLDFNGNVYSFGNNLQGQLGHGDTVFRFKPEKIQSLQDIIFISGGLQHSFCIDNKHNVYGFGNSSFGRLGINIQKNQLIPKLIPTPDEIKSIQCGYEHSLFLDVNNQVYSCGSSYYGQLGLGDFEKRYTLTLIPDLEDIIDIKSSIFTSFCLDSDRELFYFGENISPTLYSYCNNALHDTKKINKPQKVSIPELLEIKSIECGNRDIRILESNGDVWIFGRIQNPGVNGKLLVDKNIQYISDGGRYMFMKSSTCTYGYGNHQYEQLGIAKSNYQDIIELPSEIHSKISIPISYSRIKSARK